MVCEVGLRAEVDAGKRRWPVVEVLGIVVVARYLRCLWHYSFCHADLDLDWTFAITIGTSRQ